MIWIKLTLFQVDTTDESDDLYKIIEVEVKGHDMRVLNSYEKFVAMTAAELDINVAKM